MDAFPCMNCKKPITQAEGKFFAQVYVCETCFTTAESFYKKLEQELRQLLTMSKEALRIALVQGKFHLSEAKVRDISKKEVLEEILRMEALKNGPRATDDEWPKTVEVPAVSSGSDMPPHVRTLAALGESSSTKPRPQD